MRKRANEGLKFFLQHYPKIQRLSLIFFFFLSAKVSTKQLNSSIAGVREHGNYKVILINTVRNPGLNKK